MLRRTSISHINPSFPCQVPCFFPLVYVTYRASSDSLSTRSVRLLGDLPLRFTSLSFESAFSSEKTIRPWKFDPVVCLALQLGFFGCTLSPPFLSLQILPYLTFFFPRPCLGF